MDEPGGHYTKWSKVGTEIQRLHDLVESENIKLKKKRDRERARAKETNNKKESRMVDAKAWG